MADYTKRDFNRFDRGKPHIFYRCSFWKTFPTVMESVELSSIRGEHSTSIALINIKKQIRNKAIRLVRRFIWCNKLQHKTT